MKNGMKNTLSSKDWILISSYLDDQLDPKQKEQLEARLASDLSLQKGLEGLRRTRAVLRAAPQRKVPRSFTLTPEMVSQIKPFSWLTMAFSLSSAAAAILAVILISFDILPSLGGVLRPFAPMTVQKEAVALEIAPAEAAPSVYATEPAIIFWNAPAMGGGDTLIMEGLGGGPEAPIGIGGDQDSSLYTNRRDITQPQGVYTIIIPSALGEEEDTTATRAPAIEEQSQPTAAAKVEKAPQAAETRTVEKSMETFSESETNQASEWSGSPILGIQPTPAEEISEFQADREQERIPVASSTMIRRAAGGILAAIAVIMAAFALWAVRRTKR